MDYCGWTCGWTIAAEPKEKRKKNHSLEIIHMEDTATNFNTINAAGTNVANLVHMLRGNTTMTTLSLFNGGCP